MESKRWTGASRRRGRIAGNPKALITQQRGDLRLRRHAIFLPPLASLHANASVSLFANKRSFQGAGGITRMKLQALYIKQGEGVPHFVFVLLNSPLRESNSNALRVIAGFQEGVERR